MSRLTELRRVTDDYRSAELITGALQDISATKMQAIRKGFDSNVRFFEGIREVYAIIKAHSLKLSAARGNGASPRAGGRDLYVALTSNKRFYGTLNRDIIRAFMQLIASARDSDFLIIGQTGAQYFELMAKGLAAVAHAQFADDTPTHEELRDLRMLIGTYSRVFVVYPKFVNPFRQDVAVTDITQTPSGSISSDIEAEYIFEPEIPGMVAFFEAQVRHALFERIILETELARAAARMLKMRNAREHASHLHKEFGLALRREAETAADVELMETFSGYSFWKQ